MDARKVGLNEVYGGRGAVSGIGELRWMEMEGGGLYRIYMQGRKKVWVYRVSRGVGRRRLSWGMG